MNLKKSLIAIMAPAAVLADILELQAQLPTCSLGCLSDGADKFGCVVTDLTCMCTKVEEMTKEVAPCLVNVGDCELEEILQTTELVAEMCMEHFQANNISLSTNETDANKDSNEDSADDAGSAVTVSIRLALAAVIVATVCLL